MLVWLSVVLCSVVAYNYEHPDDQPPLLCDCHTTCKGPELVYYCGTGEEDQWVNPCTQAGFSGFPFCDESLAISERVKDLLSRVPEDEKLGSPCLPSVGVRYVQWWSEALHGVAISPGVKYDRTTPSATSFPQIVSTSHSFNRSLYTLIGAAIATEVRAFANVGHAGLTYWTPNLNIFRDPRWGRGQETPGEDPYLTSEYVASYVPGLQFDSSRDPSASTLKVSACCKHYAAYSLEDYEGVDRHHFDAIVTAQDMADTYMPAFEACAAPSRGGGSCIMCSYNSINGVPSCANKPLLDHARVDWGFEGYIVSDCGAVEDVYDTHHYAPTPVEAISDTLEAGMDMECGKWFDRHLEEAVSSGRVTMAQVDLALTNLFTVLMRLGRFNRNGPFDGITLDEINSKAHQALAAEAARQSVVMLKNEPVFNGARDRKTLPLALTTESTLKIAVIGPNANATRTMQGNYNGPAPYLISPLMAMAAHANVDVTYALGCDIDSSSTEGFNEALQAVGEADAVVLVMGIDQSQEREGLDRTSITLPGVQKDLIEEVLSAATGTKLPLVLVIMAGGAVCLEPYKDDPRVGGILFVGYPGQAGGLGVSDVVFGNFNPSGRLTQTFYKQSFLDEVSFFDMGMRKSVNSTTGEVVNPGRGYRFYEGDSIVYEFGHGLSYADFEYSLGSDGKATQIQYGIRDELSVLLDVVVTNKDSAIAGEEVVLVYVIPPADVSIEGTPSKQLRYFDKVSLHPQESKTVFVKLTAIDFSLADSDGQLNVVHGLWTVVVGTVATTVLI